MTAPAENLPFELFCPSDDPWLTDIKTQTSIVFLDYCSRSSTAYPLRNMCQRLINLIDQDQAQVPGLQTR
jgi:hypothetical protein